ncbi:MAG: FtsX-like permease family protein, partial [Campylobacterota bacterium]|nr:FtsX-like permease family protein [Campylobacterota bacterium]
MFDIVLKTAFLSLLRRKVRTILVIFMITISLWSLLFMQGIYEGMYQQMVNNAIKSDSGHLSIYAKGFKQDKSIDLQIRDFKNIENRLKQNSDIKSYIKRVQSSGLIATASYSNSVQIYGIDLKEEKIHSQLDKYIIDGKYSFDEKEIGSKSRGVIVGFKLAKKLKLKVGKKIILSSQNINNEISSISLKVAGIIKTSNMQIDKMGIFIDIKKRKNFFGIDGVSQVSIIFNDRLSIKKYQDNLKKSFPSLEIFRWDQQYPALLQAQEMMQQFSFISYLVVFFVATIGIFGVVLVSVLERKREFGILRAIGTKFSIIGSIIFFESFFIGIVGFIFGSVLGGATLYYFNTYGLDLTTFSDALDEFGMDTVTYAIIKLEYFIMAFFSVFIAMVLSVLIPLKILKKLKPTEMIN